ncbi:DUF4132 domain-containing protein [Spirillospora sp. NPDC029432]|uniref:DUF4132 domain-containing protein n=1 Tax=Spirillospora sp. NPDC029432 TaxID=3154599 RepID=UPI003453341A
MEDRLLPDENSLVIPDAWLPLLHPRRGGTAVPEVAVSATAPKRVAAKVRKAADWFERVLAAEESEPEPVRAVRAYLEGEADPLGAAAVGTMMAARERWDDPRSAVAHVDAWTAEHGIAFTAAAFVLLGDLGSDRYGGYRDDNYIRLHQQGDYRTWVRVERQAGRRIRTLLAAAGEDEHRDAEARLEALRDTPRRRLVAAYLMPHRADWVEECRAAPPAREDWWMLLCSAQARHLDLLDGRVPAGWADDAADVVATLVEGAGNAAAPLIIEEADGAYRAGPPLEALAILPSDAAFGALRRFDADGDTAARAALRDAMERFPVRTIRVLARRGDEEPLTAHLRRHRDRLDDLDEASREAAEALIEADPQVPDAPAAELPAFLVDPPWLREGAIAEPVVIKGLAPPAGTAVRWAPGERESWAADAPPVPAGGAGWDDELAAFRRGSVHAEAARHVALVAPEELVRPLLADWDPVRPWTAEDWMPPIVARFGADALPAVLRVFKHYPAEYAWLLLPFLDARVARQMAEWLRRRKTGRDLPQEWFERHGLSAVPLLVPAALGKPGPARLDAEAALRLVASRHGDEPVVRAARAHGDAAADAVEALLAADPLAVFPAELEIPGSWAAAHYFPRILLRDRERALPLTATGHLITLLAVSRPGEVHPGVDAVRELCDPESLAEFSWELFEAWRGVGAPAAHAWALPQLGWFGDDTTVRRLTPVVRAWPGENMHHRAVTGLDVLAEIGTDAALLALHGIALKAKFAALKARAQEKIEDVAEALGLTAEQLADRLVPDFGLAADGSMVLDYGPRRFVVGFDEQLKPYVTDEDGKRRKALPKPGAKDDQELAPAAYQRFADLKKGVRTIASDQIRRLETAMVAGRTWTAGEFRDFFFRHPLMWHIARRLVWAAEHEGTRTTFRVAEDRTFADADDAGLTLPDGAEIGVPHPVLLTEKERAVWGEVFADYEILQPFPQLGRDVHAFTEEERGSGRLERFEGVTVPPHAVVSLVRRGWERGTAEDNGVERWISKPLPGGLHAVIDLRYGINIGAIESSGDQTLEYVWINDVPTDFWPSKGTRHTFGTLDAVAASELLADLTYLESSA